MSTEEPARAELRGEHGPEIEWPTGEEPEGSAPAWKALTAQEFVDFIAALREHNGISNDMTPQTGREAAIGQWAYERGISEGRRQAAEERGTGRQWIFPLDSKVDAVHADGSHRYWSARCRHNNHGLCGVECRQCSTRCICDCHKAADHG